MTQSRSGVRLAGIIVLVALAALAGLAVLVGLWGAIIPSDETSPDSNHSG